MNIPATYTMQCAECGRWAATIAIFAPGEPLPEGRPLQLHHLDEWRVEFETPQQGGMTSSGLPEPTALRRALAAGDLKAIHQWGRPIAAAVCPTCPAFYCEEHQTAIRVYESGGAPQYDYYFETTCCKGHRNTFERD